MTKTPAVPLVAVVLKGDAKKDALGRYGKGNTIGNRFQPGNPGPGRRRTLYEHVNEIVRGEGRTVHEVVVKLFELVMKAAEKGDVNAMKILVDKLTEPDSTKLQLTAIELTPSERVARIRAVIAEAKGELGQDLLE